MFLKPPHGREYRDPATKDLIPHAGRQFDPNNLDVARALRDGDLVPVQHKKPSALAGGSEE